MPLQPKTIIYPQGVDEDIFTALNSLRYTRCFHVYKTKVVKKNSRPNKEIQKSKNTEIIYEKNKKTYLTKNKSFRGKYGYTDKNL